MADSLPAFTFKDDFFPVVASMSPVLAKKQHKGKASRATTELLPIHILFISSQRNYRLFCIYKLLPVAAAGQTDQIYP